MNNKDGIGEYSKDAMFPAMGAFSGYMFHSSIEYIGNPVLTAAIVYLTIFTLWVVIRTSASVVSKKLIPTIKSGFLSFMKKVVRG